MSCSGDFDVRPRRWGKSFNRLYKAAMNTKPKTPIRPIMAKMVNPYDALTKELFVFRRSMASPTCIAVRIRAMKTVAVANQVRFSRNRSP